MYVWDISWSSKTKGKNKFLDYTITVRYDSDNDGTAEVTDALVSDATVYSTLTHSDTGDYWTFSGITDSNGQVEFTQKVTSTGDYKAEVTDITHGAHTYNPALDVDNPDYYTLT